MRCEEKRPYATKAIAIQAASKAKKTRGIELFAYRCPTCKQWHLTHQSQALVGLGRTAA